MMGSIRSGVEPIIVLYSYVRPLLGLSIAHYPLLIIHYTLYITHYTLLIIHYTLYITHYTLFR